MTRSQQDLLRHYGIRPVKRRGQNFLLDGNLARSIAGDVLALAYVLLATVFTAWMVAGVVAY